MLDINFIKENKQRVLDAIKNKNREGILDLEELLKVDEQRRSLIETTDQIKQKQNIITEQIKNANPEKRNQLISEATELKTESAAKDEELTKIMEKFNELMNLVPNITDENMPVGKDESENQVVHQWGEKPDFDFKIKDHMELGEDLDIIDMETATQVTGARFYYLKGDLVRLQFGIIQMVLETLTDREIIGKLAHGVDNPHDTLFVPMLVPQMIKPEIMKKMDRLDPIDDRFRTLQDNLVLIGSAEHTLGPIHMDDVFELEKLPLRYIGYSTSYRREAGSYGKDTRGILRVHQFDKLEMESFTTQEMGGAEQRLMVAIQEYLVQQLGIPYQLIHICTGDTGKPDYDQFDIECWIPSQDKYRETHTSDYMTDYQSRRLNIKYKDVNGEKKLVHMNDATAFAMTRVLIAIMENNQQSDGTIIIPEVLRKYIGKEKIEKR